MNKYLVVATQDELRLQWAKAYADCNVIVTGVGATNVIRALKDIPRDSEIINVGFAGSSCFPIGSVQWVRDCRLYHPNVEFKEQSYSLQEFGKCICLTAGDFVLNGENLPDHCIVDMELAYICAFGFKSVKSIKYISDNLDYKQYEKTLKSGRGRE